MTAIELPRPLSDDGPANRRVWLRLALGVWAIAAAVVTIRLLFQSKINHTVFDAFWTAGRHWIAGEDYYGNPNLMFRYSPAVAAAFGPFGLFPQRAGEIVWRWINLGVFLFGMWEFFRVCVPKVNFVSRAAALLISAPMGLASFNNGQSNALLAGMLLYSVVATQQRRWNLAAVLLSVAVLFKVWPVAIAGLLCLVYPRQLPWRLAIGMVVGFASPFALQRPGYVMDQYRQWTTFLSGDLRLEYSVLTGYRDLWQLLRLFGEPLTQKQYQILQLTLAAAAAATVFVAGLRGVSTTRRSGMALMLGMCWCMLCGPATESCTYTLMAPLLAWALLDPDRGGEPAWSRTLLLLSFTLFMSAEVANIFPFAAIAHSFGIQPMATIALGLRHLLTQMPAMREPEAGREQIVIAAAA